MEVHHHYIRENVLCGDRKLEPVYLSISKLLTFLRRGYQFKFAWFRRQMGMIGKEPALRGVLRTILSGKFKD